MIALSFLVKKKSNPNPSPFKFSKSYGMAVFNFNKNNELKAENIYNCEDISSKPEITTYIVPPQEVGYVMIKVKK